MMFPNWLPALTVLTWLSYPCCPVLDVLSWRSFGWPVLCCPVLIVLYWRPNSHYPVLVLLTLLFWYLCSWKLLHCPVLTIVVLVLFPLSCFDCPCLAVKFGLYSSGCPLLNVLIRVSCSHHGFRVESLPEFHKLKSKRTFPVKGINKIETTHRCICSRLR